MTNIFNLVVTNIGVI